ICFVGALGRTLNVQRVRLACGLRAPPRSWTLLVALARAFLRRPSRRPWSLSALASGCLRHFAGAVTLDAECIRHYADCVNPRRPRFAFADAADAARQG